MTNLTMLQATLNDLSSKDELINFKKENGLSFSLKGNFNTCRKRAESEVGKQVGQEVVKSQENAAMEPEMVCMVYFDGKALNVMSIPEVVELISPCSLGLLLNRSLSYKGYSIKGVVL